ncbi:MAG TPA: type II CAAX endopeptidase family protein [Fimbriimonas sp.]|nr:type II CAAX endopeptidase family protein [Fimbriimonas sp.]
MSEYPRVPPHILSAEPEPGTLRWVFFGKAGLRAGWGLLIYFALLICLLIPAVLVMIALGETGQAGLKTVRSALIQEAPQLAVVLIATFVMSLIERRKVTSYWLAGSEIARKFASGLLGGFLAMSLLIGILLGFHLLVFQNVLLQGTQIATFGLLWFVVFFLVGFFEELLLRGYFHYTLTRGISFFWSSLITSLLFGLMHLANPGETAIGIFSVFGAGAIFCVMLRVTGSLYFAIGFHASWDWAQSFLFSVPDSGTLSEGRLMQTHAIGNSLLSGGTAGPEGSVFVFPVMLLAAAACYLIYRPKPQPASK